MQLSTQTFQISKKGCSQSEYEDACYPVSCFRGELRTYRCAVADGATESAFSREWAQLLVQGFGEHRAHLKDQQSSWRKLVNQNPLPWYLERKVTQGAHAAFVGLSLRDPVTKGSDEELGKGTWRAFAVGDSCLFHVRDGELLEAWPISKSEEFDNNPFLLSTTCSSPLSRDDEFVSVFSGTWESKDSFYLASDAMAQWLLSEQEASRPPWSFLHDLSPKTFERVVEILRGTKRLHNDDTTILRIEVI